MEIILDYLVGLSGVRRARERNSDVTTEASLEDDLLQALEVEDRALNPGTQATSGREKRPGNGPRSSGRNTACSLPRSLCPRT